MELQRLLKQAKNCAEKGRKVFKEKLETNRSRIIEKVRPELMQSVVNIIRREKKHPSSMVQNRLNGNFDTLSERQNRQLRNCFQSNVEIMDGGELR